MGETMHNEMYTGLCKGCIYIYIHMDSRTLNKVILTGSLRRDSRGIYGAYSF